MTRTRVRAVVLLGCLALALTTLGGQRPASAQSDQWDALFDRIIRLEHEVKEMKSGGGAVPLNPSAPSAIGDGGSGAVEDQLRQVLAMLDEIRQTQRDLDMRLRQLEGASDSTGSIFEQQPQAGSEPSQNDGFDFSRYESRELAELSAEQDVSVYREYEPQASNEPQVLGTLSGSQLYEQNQLPDSGGDASISSGNSGSLLPETVERAALDGDALPPPSDGSGGATGGSAGGSAEKLYQSGYESLLGRRFGDAEGSFKMFVDRHRDHQLASDAHFWLGETYYVQGDYKQAAQSFLKGYKDYPDGRKAPDTLFKLGLSLQQLEQTAQACSTFAEVAKKYPTAADVRNEALKEMQRAGC
ncbi:MAG: tol-pal system protein YbgF [Hyphomicrobiales bacterium]